MNFNSSIYLFNYKYIIIIPHHNNIIINIIILYKPINMYLHIHTCHIVIYCCNMEIMIYIQEDKSGSNSRLIMLK